MATNHKPLAYCGACGTPALVTPDGAGWHVTDHHTPTCPTQNPEGIALVEAITKAGPR